MSSKIWISHKNTSNANAFFDFSKGFKFFFTEHWFWRAGLDQHEDEFEAIRRQRVAGTGPGYRFWDDELGRFDLIGQYNRVRLETDIGDRDFATSSLELDYKRLLWGTRLEFATDRSGASRSVVESVLQTEEEARAELETLFSDPQEVEKWLSRMPLKKEKATA